MLVSPSAINVKLQLTSAENVVKREIKEKNSLLLPPPSTPTAKGDQENTVHAETDAVRTDN